MDSHGDDDDDDDDDASCRKLVTHPPELSGSPTTETSGSE
jgi:hypothetical protein